jgi:hypothetical protein
MIGWICRLGQTRVLHTYIIANINMYAEAITFTLKRNREENNIAMRKQLTAAQAEMINFTGQSSADVNKPSERDIIDLTKMDTIDLSGNMSD